MPRILPQDLVVRMTAALQMGKIGKRKGESIIAIRREKIAYRLLNGFAASLLKVLLTRNSNWFDLSNRTRARFPKDASDFANFRQFVNGNWREK